MDQHRDYKVKLKRMKYDFAELFSRNVESANQYMNKEGIDFDNLIQKGIKSIKIASEMKHGYNELNKQQTYFRRVVLAAEITKELYMEITFGHVKLQKLMYLSEKICQYDFSDRYLKQTAGPMDHKFIHSIDKEFEKQNWFFVTREGKYKKFTYHPLPGLDKQEGYYVRYYSKYTVKIKWLLEIFRIAKTDTVELIATLFACWEGALQKGEPITDSLLVSRVYNWSKEKVKFKEAEIINSIRWMEENEFYPSIFN